MSRPTSYVWLDLETTGTDEHDDPILELGFVLTDSDLSVLARDGWAISPPLGWENQLSDYVRDMHTTNGLLDAVRASEITLGSVDFLMTNTLALWGHPKDFILCGSGVSHFDRRFIAAQMPKLNRWFRYYNIDVGILRRSLVLIGREDLLLPFDQQEKTHRALEDAELHLAEFKYIKDALGAVPA
jgi:oligoribonuclease